MKLWRPDTCGCEFEVGPGYKTLVEVTRRCPAHQSGTDADVFATCRAENAGKNYAREAMLAHLGIDDSEIGERVVMGIAADAERSARALDAMIEAVFSGDPTAVVGDVRFVAEGGVMSTITALRDDLDRLTRRVPDPYRWSFAPDRTLVISAAGRTLSAADRAAIVDGARARGVTHPVRVR